MFLNPKQINVTQPFEFFDELNSISLNEIENLVFSGGGIKGLAYVGIARYLDSKKDGNGQSVLDKIQRFAGASAGAINATLLAIGMSVDDIEKQMRKEDKGKELFPSFLQSKDIDLLELEKHLTHFSGFKDWNAIAYIEDAIYIAKAIKIAYEQYGEIDGVNFTNWLEEMLGMSKKYGNKIHKNITFSDLKDVTGKELHIIVCDSSYGKTVVANHVTKPEMMIKDAVRASMAIPFVFTPLQKVYVDGGTMYNYPVEIFDDETGAPEKTLGFILSTSAKVLYPNKNEPKDFWNHAANILNCLNSVSNEYCFRLGNQYRTVFIDTGDVGGLDFKLDDDKKNKLIANGKTAVETYFAEVYGPKNNLPMDRKNAFAVVVPPGNYAEFSFDIEDSSNVNIIIYGNIYDGDTIRQITRNIQNTDIWTTPTNTTNNAKIYMITGWSPVGNKAACQQDEDGTVLWQQDRGRVRYQPESRMKVGFWNGEGEENYRYAEANVQIKSAK